MKKIFYSSLITIALASCGGENTSETGKNEVKNEDTSSIVNDIDTIQETTIGDSIQFEPNYVKPYDGLAANEVKIFKLFLGDSLTAEVIALHKMFDQVKSAENMRDYYAQMIDLKSKLSYKLSDKLQDAAFRKKVLAQAKNLEIQDEYFDEYSTVLDEMRTQLDKLKKYYHGIKPSCVAECTEPYFGLVIKDLVPIAEKTDGDDDNKYFKLIVDFYTEEWEPTSMNAKWFEATWDYGGSSKLGDGIHLNFMLTTDKLIAEKNIFEQWILGYREDCFSDMTRWKSFQYGKEKILKEIDKVFKQVKLDPSQIDQLKARKKELNEFIENDKTGYGLQLNCETGDCIYG